MIYQSESDSSLRPYMHDPSFPSVLHIDVHDPRLCWKNQTGDASAKTRAYPFLGFFFPGNCDTFYCFVLFKNLRTKNDTIKI